VKGLKIDTKNEFIVTWNKASLCFHHLNNKEGKVAGSLLFSIKDLVPPEEEITDLLINMEYRYFYNSTTSGQISVWKFDNSKK